MDDLERELKILGSYNDIYYYQTIDDLSELQNNNQYDLFVSCYKKCFKEYNKNVRWENLFDKLLAAFKNIEFRELIKNILNEDLTDSNIQILNSILLEGENIYEISNINDLTNATTIKTNILNELYGCYQQGETLQQLSLKFKIIDRKITTEEQLLKDIIFRKTFNISYTEANILVNTYEKNISNANGIDQSLISFINSLSYVYNLNDLEDLTKLAENTPVSTIDSLNYDTIERIIASSYSSVFNQSVYKPNASDLIGTIGNEIPIYEIGNQFYMNVHSVGGVFANDTRKYKKDWQSRENLFISTSFIGNINMNTCPINNVCYGFSSFNNNDILDAGFMNLHTTDGYGINPISCCKNGNINHVKYAMPQKFLKESSITEWNEIAYRRFDEDGDRINPDYIVYFSEGQINHQDQIWKNSVKAAQEFSIPIVVINKKKINEYNNSNQTQNEFVAQQTVYFDNTKLNKILFEFNEAISKNNQKEERNNHMSQEMNNDKIITQSNILTSNEFEIETGKLINQKNELERKLNELKQKTVQQSDIQTNLSIMKIEHEISIISNRIKSIRAKQKTSDLNNIRNILGVSFDNHIYTTGLEENEMKMILKTSSQLQMEYLQYIRDLDVMLENDQINEQQYDIVMKSLSDLYTQYNEELSTNNVNSNQTEEIVSFSDLDDIIDLIDDDLLQDKIFLKMFKRYDLKNASEEDIEYFINEYRKKFIDKEETEIIEPVERTGRIM